MLAISGHIESRLRPRISTRGCDVLRRPDLPPAPALNIVWRPERKYHLAAGLAGAVSFPLMVVLAIGTGLPFGIAASLSVAHLAAVVPSSGAAERARMNRIVSGLAILWAGLCIISIAAKVAPWLLVWEALASLAVAAGPSISKTLSRTSDSSAITGQEIQCLEAYAIGEAVIVTDRAGRLLGSTWAARRMIDGLEHRCSPDIHQIVDIADRNEFSSAFLRGSRTVSGASCHVRLTGGSDTVTVRIRHIGMDRLAITLASPRADTKVSALCPDPVQQARRGRLHTAAAIDASFDRLPTGSTASVGEVVEFALRLTRRDADKSGITLETSGTDQRVNVTCDHRTLVQIVINLLNNAIKFSNHAGRVSISVSRLQHAALICIADRGVGIAAADQERIFDFRGRCGDGSRPGHGLGLAIVRDLVDGSGGAITLSSEPGRGTTVEVRLPLAGDSTVGSDAANLEQMAWRVAAE